MAEKLLVQQFAERRSADTVNLVGDGILHQVRGLAHHRAEAANGHRCASEEEISTAVAEVEP